MKKNKKSSAAAALLKGLQLHVEPSVTRLSGACSPQCVAY